MWERLDKSFERANREYHRVIARSAGGALVAAQWGFTSGAGHAAVWDVASKRVAWEPEGATSICWIGDEVLATRLDPTRKQEVVDWYDHASRVRLGSIAIKYPIGAWLTHPPMLVACGPARTVAAVWMDQSEAGFELLRRGTAGWEQITGWGYFARSNCVEEGVFSNDARSFALPYGAPNEWWERPKPNGSASCGMVAVIDLADGALGFVDLIAQLAPGWEPTPRTSSAPTIHEFDGNRLDVELQNTQRVTLEVDRLAFRRPDGR
jgi:hypothetical protein